MEFAGLGPGPFAAMLLSDMGAEILRIDRLGAECSPRDVLSRGRRSLAVDLKTPRGVDQCLSLMACADVVIEGFRPGVMERRGLGPDVALATNPRLIYGRMTGWGQVGPLAQAAGHDINYIAITGALAGVGPADGVPLPPLNLVGDFGGGSLYLALGIAAALFERGHSGKGQVIDAAIVDGAASLMAIFSSFLAEGRPVRRGQNILDGSAHYYRCYVCADGRHIAIGAIEPRFYQVLLDLAGIPHISRVPQSPLDWESGTAVLAEVFKRKTREEWCNILEGTDACFAPVLELDEAPLHRHNAARAVFIERFGVVQPAPAPRFSRTPGQIQGPPPAIGEGGAELAARWQRSRPPQLGG
jgi:alpha-methylacyl-CoA racemase